MNPGLEVYLGELAIIATVLIIVGFYAWREERQIKRAKGEDDRWRELYGSEDDRLHLPSNGPTTHVLCQTCGGMWLVDDEEEHAPGCEA